VNAVDLAQNIKQSVPLVNYCLIIPLHSYKVNKLGCSFINILPRVKCVMFSLRSHITHHTN